MMIRALIGLLVIGCCGVSQAAPVLQFSLEGRPYGSSDSFASNVAVQAGDTIEYRLRLFLGSPTIPIDQVRRNLFGTTLHGAIALSLDIVQHPDAAIQVDFDESGVLRDGWERGTGARGGSLSMRPNGLGRDLIDVRPIHWPGTYTAWDAETVLSGTFTVASIAGDSADVEPRWGTVSGAYYFNGENHFLLPQNPTRSNGAVQFSPQNLTAVGLAPVPEPSTIALLGAAVCGLIFVRRGLQ